MTRWMTTITSNKSCGILDQVTCTEIKIMFNPLNARLYSTLGFSWKKLSSVSVKVNLDMKLIFCQYETDIRLMDQEIVI